VETTWFPAIGRSPREWYWLLPEEWATTRLHNETGWFSLRSEKLADATIPGATARLLAASEVEGKRTLRMRKKPEKPVWSKGDQILAFHPTLAVLLHESNPLHEG
jgi:hypothetical protein